MSPGLQGEVVMMLNKTWMDRVRMLKPIITLAQDKDTTRIRQIAHGQAFLVDLSM
eukprot:CAMPEP_0172696528 /NCGR_PEP_ID=MMETSP1074-20121228/28117_1 /TAXON_ID=2916 /ORGANISM="Ceratium fusus, Strain PA161109" /LENGTH=54 /DNA_ID=CAMNT_0013517287 /DNA_START=1 /DNA_END=162 /DNA_ORIENTATION=-